MSSVTSWVPVPRATHTNALDHFMRLVLNSNVKLPKLTICIVSFVKFGFLNRDFFFHKHSSIQFSSLVNIPSIRGVQWVLRLLFHPSSPNTHGQNFQRLSSLINQLQRFGILLTSGVFNLVSSRSKSWFNWPRKSIATYFSKPLVFNFLFVYLAVLSLSCDVWS